jgi:hypothetical protein
LWDIELIRQNNTVEELGGAPNIQSKPLIKVLVSQKSGVAPIRDSAIGLLSPKLTPAPKSILGQDSGDFTRNNESTNYNNHNSVGRADPQPIRNTRSP